MPVSPQISVPMHTVRSGCTDMKGQIFRAWLYRL